MLTINLTPQTLDERLQQWEERRRGRLLQTAEALQMEATPDPITGGWAVRSPQHPGYVELVTEAGCTCPEYASLGDCSHTAYICAMLSGETQP